MEFLAGSKENKAGLYILIRKELCEILPSRKEKTHLDSVVYAFVFLKE